MANVLHIIGSPRVESYSARVAKAFLDSYRQARPEDRIEVLDLYKTDIPPFTAPQAKAKYAVMAGQAPKSEAEAAWQAVIKTINHFKGFDKYVLSSPMWNFSIPYRLKQYIDVIVQPSLTVSYSPEKGYTGLVSGRPLMLILSRGGEYRTGNPCETYDFQEPTCDASSDSSALRTFGQSASRARCRTSPSRSRPTPAGPLPRPRPRPRNSPAN